MGDGDVVFREERDLVVVELDAVGGEEQRAEDSVLGEQAGAERPDALAASDVLELATLGSARALGLDGEVGSLAVGKCADLAVVSLAGSPFLPWEDPAAAVVFGGSPDRVELTLVDGEERYRKGGDRWPELRRSAESARARMLVEAPPDGRLRTAAQKT